MCSWSGFCRSGHIYSSFHSHSTPGKMGFMLLLETKLHVSWWPAPNDQKHAVWLIGCASHGGFWLHGFIFIISESTFINIIIFILIYYFILITDARSTRTGLTHKDYNGRYPQCHFLSGLWCTTQNGCGSVWTLYREALT